MITSDTRGVTGLERAGDARLRIAIISNSLPIRGRNVGGVAHFADELATGLAARGHLVTGWTYDLGEGSRSYQVRQLPGSGFARTRVGRLLTEGYLGNLLTVLARYSNADVIIAMGDSLLLPILGKPLVRVFQGSALREAINARSPIRVVCQLGIYPQELLTAITQKGCVAGSVNTLRDNPFIRRLIVNGVDLSTFSPAPKKSDEPSILFVGTMEGRKRGNLLLEWFEEGVRSRVESATLTVVGSRGRPSAGVSYLRGISRDELANLYRRSWVYASASVYEGFGLPYVEAMASGTAVIATPNPGSREILGDGQFGILATDKEFAESLVRLLTSAEERQRLGSLGLVRAGEYSRERMIDAYERLLWEITSQVPAIRRRPATG
jgi:phosphatidyl-myo-inositol alpha-mannosyltransferase